MELALGGVSLVVLIGILVQVIKQFNVPKRLIPAISLVIGIVLGVTAHFLSGVPLFESAISGLVSGAAASGLYDVGKKSVLNK